jgi:hypothetical protein
MPSSHINTHSCYLHLYIYKSFPTLYLLIWCWWSVMGLKEDSSVENKKRRWRRLYVYIYVYPAVISQRRRWRTEHELEKRYTESKEIKGRITYWDSHRIIQWRERELVWNRTLKVELKVAGLLDKNREGWRVSNFISDVFLRE